VAELVSNRRFGEGAARVTEKRRDRGDLRRGEGVRRHEGELRLSEGVRRHV